MEILFFAALVKKFLTRQTSDTLTFSPYGTVAPAVIVPETHAFSCLVPHLYPSNTQTRLKIPLHNGPSLHQNLSTLTAMPSFGQLQHATRRTHTCRISLTQSTPHSHHINYLVAPQICIHFTKTDFSALPPPLQQLPATKPSPLHHSTSPHPQHNSKLLCDPNPRYLPSTQDDSPSSSLKLPGPLNLTPFIGPALSLSLRAKNLKDTARLTTLQQILLNPSARARLP